MYNYAACGVTGSDSRGYDTLREGEVRSHREFSKVLDLLQVDAYGVVLQSNVSMYTLPRASNNTCGSCELPKPGANEDEFAVTGMVDPEAVQRAVNAPGVVAVMTVPVPAKPETAAVEPDPVAADNATVGPKPKGRVGCGVKEPPGFRERALNFMGVKTDNAHTESFEARDPRPGQCPAEVAQSWGAVGRLSDSSCVYLRCQPSGQLEVRRQYIDMLEALREARAEQRLLWTQQGELCGPNTPEARALLEDSYTLGSWISSGSVELARLQRLLVPVTFAVRQEFTGNAQSSALEVLHSWGTSIPLLCRAAPASSRAQDTPWDPEVSTGPYTEKQLNHFCNSTSFTILDPALLSVRKQQASAAASQEARASGASRAAQRKNKKSHDAQRFSVTSSVAAGVAGARQGSAAAPHPLADKHGFWRLFSEPADKKPAPSDRFTVAPRKKAVWEALLQRTPNAAAPAWPMAPPWAGLLPDGISLPYDLSDPLDYVPGICAYSSLEQFSETDNCARAFEASAALLGAPLLRAGMCDQEGARKAREDKRQAATKGANGANGGGSSAAPPPFAVPTESDGSVALVKDSDYNRTFCAYMRLDATISQACETRVSRVLSVSNIARVLTAAAVAMAKDERGDEDTDEFRADRSDRADESPPPRFARGGEACRLLNLSVPSPVRLRSCGRALVALCKFPQMLAFAASPAFSDVLAPSLMKPNALPALMWGLTRVVLAPSMFGLGEQMRALAGMMHNCWDVDPNSSHNSNGRAESDECNARAAGGTMESVGREYLEQLLHAQLPRSELTFALMRGPKKAYSHMQCRRVDCVVLEAVARAAEAHGTNVVEHQASDAERMVLLPPSAWPSRVSDTLYRSALAIASLVEHLFGMRSLLDAVRARAAQLAADKQRASPLWATRLRAGTAPSAELCVALCDAGVDRLQVGRWGRLVQIYGEDKVALDAEVAATKDNLYWPAGHPGLKRMSDAFMWMCLLSERHYLEKLSCTGVAVNVGGSFADGAKMQRHRRSFGRTPGAFQVPEASSDEDIEAPDRPGLVHHQQRRKPRRVNKTLNSDSAFASAHQAILSRRTSAALMAHFFAHGDFERRTGVRSFVLSPGAHTACDDCGCDLSALSQCVLCPAAACDRCDRRICFECGEDEKGELCADDARSSVYSDGKRRFRFALDCKYCAQ